MSDIVEFPKNKEVFLKRAVDAYTSLQVSDAIKHMECALQIEQDSQLYPLYITLLLEAYELERAEQFFEQTFPQIDSIAVSLDIDVLYIRLLLELWALDQAEKVLHHRLEVYQYDSLAIQQFQLLDQQLNQQEQAHALEVAKERTEVMAQVHNIDDLSFYQQKQLLPRLHILDTLDYQEHVKYLLVSTLHPILKTYLLEMTIEKGVLMSVDMSWFGEIKTVYLDQLSEVMAHELYQKCLRYIDETVNEVHLKELLSQNMLLYFSILYPFPEVLFEKYDQFVHALIRWNQLQESDYQTEWFDTIHYFIKQMDEEGTVC